MSTIRRLYFYGVAFVALVIAANGTAFVLRYLVDLALGRQIFGGAGGQISAGLAMVLVGAPVWGLHWALAQGQVARQPLEAGAVLRKLYIFGVMFVAALIGFLAVRSLLRWALDLDAFSSIWLAQLLVWGVAWAFHWAQERREGQPSPGARTVRRWYVYLTSAYSLGTLAIGVAIALSSLLGYAYDSWTGASLLNARDTLWTPAVRSAFASVLGGTAWWTFHWLYLARGDTESTLRQVYLFLYAFLGGAVVVLTATANLLYTFLQWLLGDPDASPAAPHFRSVTQTLPVLLVGAGLLAYHWAVVKEEAERRQAGTGRRMGAQRSFGYIMAALGLASLVAGASLLLGLLIGFVVGAQERLTEPDAWRGALALALTFLVIGGPLWLYVWARVQRRAQAGGVEERIALPRRIFIYATLGILALIALGTLTGLLAILLRSLLEGHLTLDFLREDGRWLLGTALTVGAFLPYYWQVLREDQRAGAEVATGRREVTLIVSEQAIDLAERLEEALGTRPRVLRVTAPLETIPPIGPEELQTLVQRVREAPPGPVLLVALDGVVRVYTYR